jgi:mRNA interferase RelE/StbE
LSYRITVSARAEKDMLRLPLEERAKLANKIDGLVEDPRPRGCKKLKGQQEELWRIRAGNLRILYTIDDEVRIVDVRKVGDRRDVYR